VTVSPTIQPERNHSRSLVGWSIVGGATGRVGQFAAVGYLATWLSSSEFAKFAAALLTVQCLSGVFSSAVATATNRQSSARISSAKAGAVIQDAYLPIIGGAFVTVVGGVLAPPAYAVLTHRPTGTILVLAGMGVGAIVLTDSVIGAIAGQGEFRLVAIAEAFRGLTCMFVVVVIAKVAGATAGAIGVGLADLSVGIVLLLILRRRPRDKSMAAGRSMTAGARQTVKAGLAANLCAQAGLWGSQVVLARGFGLEAIAAYSLANRFASLALVLPGFLTKNMLGLLARDAAAESPAFRQHLFRYIGVVTALAAGASLVAILVGAFLFSNLFGHYPNGLAMLIVLLLSSIPSAIGSALGVACVARGRLLVWVVSDASFAVVAVVATTALFATGYSAVTSLSGLILAYAVNVLVRLLSLRRIGAAHADGATRLTVRATW